MKLTAIHWISIATLLLITVVVFALMGLTFYWVFYATVIGQIVLIFTVIKVLKEDYQTKHSFTDFYEDRPDLGK